MAHERPPTVERAVVGDPDATVAETVEPAAAAIDARTFAELYPALRQFAAAVSPAHVDPDDLVQDALARVLRRPATAAPIETPAAYLRQAVLNAERSSRRSAVRRRAIDPILAAEEASTPVYPSDLALLDALDPDDRALLYLTAVERWTFAEVGAVLNKPEASLRVRASRLRKTLRDQLTNDAQTAPGDRDRDHHSVAPRSNGDPADG